MVADIGYIRHAQKWKRPTQSIPHHPALHPTSFNSRDGNHKHGDANTMASRAFYRNSCILEMEAVTKRCLHTMSLQVIATHVSVLKAQKHKAIS